jgi:hypothetical protein
MTRVTELNASMQALAAALRAPRDYSIGRWIVVQCPCPSDPAPHYLLVGHDVARSYSTRASAIRAARTFDADDQRMHQP